MARETPAEAIPEAYCLLFFFVFLAQVPQSVTCYIFVLNHCGDHVEVVDQFEAQSWSSSEESEESGGGGGAAVRDEGPDGNANARQGKPESEKRERKENAGGKKKRDHRQTRQRKRSTSSAADIEMPSRGQS